MPDSSAVPSVTESVPQATSVALVIPSPRYHVIVIPEAGEPYDREFDKLRGDNGVLMFLASIASHKPLVRCFYGHRLHVTRPPILALVGPDGVRHPIPVDYQPGEVDPSGRLGFVEETSTQGEFPQRRIDA